ncbi:MAG: cyclic nucleotide-binding domain-containing protein [Pseudomonadota bacterium]
MSQLRVFSRKTFNAGETIFRQGERASTAYLVEAGQVDLYLGEGAARCDLESVGPNGLFGELALVDKGERSATAVAAEETTCLVLHEADLDRVMEKVDPFLRNMMQVLSARLRANNNIVEKGAMSALYAIERDELASRNAA